MYCALLVTLFALTLYTHPPPPRLPTCYDDLKGGLGRPEAVDGLADVHAGVGHLGVADEQDVLRGEEPVPPVVDFVAVLRMRSMQTV